MFGIFEQVGGGPVDGHGSGEGGLVDGVAGMQGKCFKFHGISSCGDRVAGCRAGRQDRAGAGRLFFVLRFRQFLFELRDKLPDAGAVGHLGLGIDTQQLLPAGDGPGRIVHVKEQDDALVQP